MGQPPRIDFSVLKVYISNFMTNFFILNIALYAMSHFINYRYYTLRFFMGTPSHSKIENFHNFKSVGVIV